LRSYNLPVSIPACKDVCKAVLATNIDLFPIRSFVLPVFNNAASGDDGCVGTQNGNFTIENIKRLNRDVASLDVSNVICLGSGAAVRIRENDVVRLYPSNRSNIASFNYVSPLAI